MRNRKTPESWQSQLSLSKAIHKEPATNRVRTAQGKPGKGTFWKKNQGKPGKLGEFSDHFYSLRENSGNFILPNISNQIGGALRINK